MLFKSIISSLVLFIIFVLCISLGAITVPLSDWVSSPILWQLRIPRALMSILVGASLGLAGALAQGLFRNPLADPALLGISSGAALAVALTILMSSLIQVEQTFMLPLAAFCGALLSCTLLLWVSKKMSLGTVLHLLLCGVALNAFSGAFIGLCIYLSDDTQLRTFTFWTLGSLSLSSSVAIAWMLSVLLSVAWLIYPKCQAINALGLGEQVAQHVGVNVGTLKVQMIFGIALLCGVSVAFCGMIGFVSLVAPQIVRLIVGVNQKNVLIFSMFLGALLLLLADTLARTLALPAEMPVGIFTSLIGAPYFFYLLKQKSKVLYA